ncbi:MAG: DNA repair protein RadC [Bacteroidota bacterium]|nr:DNA repair protein RadC [Bacteroidota bacterium]MDX5430536.1 DNA repair protein RadC [Bacteroidota bacterium]MDX5469289.1 DNA repair protein RadC [Bacteroidota bacterium]
MAFFILVAMNPYPTKSSIKFWAEDDRPREKFLLKGKSALSDSELLAILFATGTPKLSALDLARQVLEAYEGNIAQLARANVKELCRFNGVGMAKAVTLLAALELAGRRKESHGTNTQIKGSDDAYACLREVLQDLNHEEFWVLYLNQANRVIRRQNISSGGISGTVADPRMIFKHGIEQAASGIILAHNHPSGNLKPSQADLDLTRKLAEGAKHFDMRILDHLIITQSAYVSFADEGWL